MFSNNPTWKSLPRTGKLLIAAFAASALVLLLFVLPYSPGYGEKNQSLGVMIYSMWTRLDEWQHCFLVPIACCVAVYLMREKLGTIPLKPAYSGLALIVLAMVFYWIGYKVELQYYGFICLHLLIVGMVLWVFGYRFALALLFPLSFLIFAWPLPFLESPIAFPLRSIMSRCSAFVLNTIGVPVVLQGTGLLSAPDTLTGAATGQKFSVDVADPCSGIRSLFALMMVSALYAHFTLRTWKQKWILFLSSIPLAILGNLVRILTLTFGVIALGAPTAIGTLEEPSTFHMMAGYVVFAVALGGTVGVGWLLENFQRNREQPVQTTESPVNPPQQSRNSKEDLY